MQGRLIAKKALYTLDLGGKTPEQFRQQLKESRQTGSWPPPPEVDLALELRNGGEKELQLWVGGDVTELLLDLKGPGVVKAHGTKFFTGQTLHETVRLAPGKRYTVPIARLSYGLRGANHLAYWT
ncbi:MAG TPA: hypothetical protein VEL76_36320 [Gemmataceae bacterium]|nr:hypothetical protein [Gemmataceae bacterium]